MTYAEQAAKVGRRPFAFIEIDLDACSLTYGSSPCLAAVGVTGPDRCCNSWRTCQDQGAFDRVVKTFRFCMDGQQLAGDVAAGLNAIPSVRSISQEPSRLDMSRPLGIRAGVQIQLRDHAHNDRGIDPYVDSRAYDPATRSTLWAKMAARWPYHEGRPLRVYTGFLTDAGEIDLANFHESAFIIQKIEGPDASGKITITGKDPLRLADSDKAKLPAISRGRLLSTISAGATSLTLTTATAAQMTAYGSSGELSIDSEVIPFTSRTANAAGGDGFVSTFTVTRAARGTAAEAHEADSKAQLCASWTNADPLDVLQDLLTAAGIDVAFSDTAGWTDEQSDWMPGVVATSFLSEPQGVADIIATLCESIGFHLWWDGRDQLIKLRCIRPTIPDELTEIGDAGHIIAGTLQIQADQGKRLSQVWVYWDQIDQTKDHDKPANYRQTYVAADLEAESPLDDGGLEYQSGRTRTIFARWLPANDSTTAPQMANRLLAMYRDTPQTIGIGVDAKDSTIAIGDDLLVTSRMFVDEFGVEEPRLMRVTEAKESVEGAPVPLKCFSLGVRRRYARICPDSMVSTTYATATEAERGRYGFASNDAEPPRMSDGSRAYVIA